MHKSHIYLQEAKSQIIFARRAYQEYEMALAENDTFSVFYKLHHFIVHAANLDKLLDAKSGSARHKALNQVINFINFDIKPIRRLRNHLEHFDERLDFWVSNYDGHVFFDMNIVTGVKGFPETAFLRALDGDTYRFYGESFQLKPILDSLNQLESQIEVVLNDNNLK